MLEIHLLEADSLGELGRTPGLDFHGASGANFLGQAHLDHMTGFATAFEQAQCTSGDEAAHALACGPTREANTAGEPGNRKAEPKLPFKATVAQEMRIDRAVDYREAQPRDEKVLELFPE
jgi:hypothetical protein